MNPKPIIRGTVDKGLPPTPPKGSNLAQTK